MTSWYNVTLITAYSNCISHAYCAYSRGRQAYSRKLTTPHLYLLRAYGEVRNAHGARSTAGRIRRSPDGATAAWPAPMARPIDTVLLMVYLYLYQGVSVCKYFLVFLSIS